MKKTVVLILILLPIVLLLVIAFAGRVLSHYQHIGVESVAFVDDKGEALDDNAYITLGIGETKSTKIKIYPELAADKRVTYTSSNEAVCTVDESGNVTGVGPGSAVIIVQTVDGGKMDKLDVIVRSTGVTGITLTPDTLTLKIGDSKDLSWTITPYTATNKKITFASSNTSVVTVSATGKLKAVGAGTAVITVTTVDGGFTDTCEVTVEEGTPPLYFDFEGVDGVTSTGTGYITSENTLDTIQGLKMDDGIAQSDISLVIIQGDGATIDENGVITFTDEGLVVVKAYVGDESNPTYVAEVRIAWFG